MPGVHRIGSRPVARALSVPEPDRSPTPSIVDAGFHEVLVLLDAGVVENRGGLS